MGGATVVSLWALLVALSGASEVASGEPSSEIPLHSGMGTPFTLDKGHGVAGLFQPMSVGVGPSTELGTSAPLFALPAPRIRIKHHIGEWSGVHGAVVGSVGVPTLGLRLLSGLGVISSDPNQQATAAMVLEGGGSTGVRWGRWTQGLTTTVRVGGHGKNWGLDSPGLPFLDTTLAPLTEGPVLRLRHVNEWTVVRSSVRDVVGLRSDVLVQLGGLSPDLNLAFLVSWAPHPRWVLAGGWVGASEQMPHRRRWTSLPVGDLQIRW